MWFWCSASFRTECCNYCTFMCFCHGQLCYFLRFLFSGAFSICICFAVLFAFLGGPRVPWVLQVWSRVYHAFLHMGRGCVAVLLTGFFQGHFFCGAFIITGCFLSCRSRMVVCPVTARALILRGQFSCVVVLVMLVCSNMQQFQWFADIPQEPWHSKDSWWWGLFSCAVFGGLALRHAVSVFGILVLLTFLARVVALFGCVWCSSGVGFLLLYSVS